MPNPPNRSNLTLRDLKKGQILEIECGQCGHSGLVTLLQLTKAKCTIETRFDDLRWRMRCKRCGRKSWRTLIWARDARS